MIKTLLNADEEPSPGTGTVSEKKAVEKNIEKNVEPPPVQETKTFSETPAEDFTAPVSENLPPAAAETQRDVFEIPEDAKFFTKPVEIDENAETDFSDLSEDELEKLLMLEEENYKSLAAEDIEKSETTSEIVKNETENIPVSTPADTTEKGADETVQTKDETENTITTPYNYEPETPAETIRKSGLAYSAAIVLLASVVFMMILGWFADLLLGSSPWGIVGGIILGAIIGFIQFFRIASSIFKQ